METTAYEIVTAVTDNLPVITDTQTNSIDVFFYDVAQYNGNSANFFNSVAKYANNIINAIASCEKYFVWVHDIADTIYNSSDFPVWFGSAVSVGLFFLLINFFRR